MWPICVQKSWSILETDTVSPKANQYTDYREMLEKEQPDIVSVATQPEHRAEIVIYAAEHGVKAIYAEKAMAASMDEAAAMVAAVRTKTTSPLTLAQIADGIQGSTR